MSCESNPKGLTAPDFFLWGYLKEEVFVTTPDTGRAEGQDHRGNGRINAATLERAMEGVLSRARSCVAHNGCHLTDVVLHAWKYKTSVHSLSFEASFVLMGAIARSHDKNKSASRLLGHLLQDFWDKTWGIHTIHTYMHAYIHTYIHTYIQGMYQKQVQRWHLLQFALALKLDIQLSKVIKLQ